MSADALPLLSAAALTALARAERPGRCDVCAPLVCPGWESVPTTFDTALLQRVGTLRREEVDEPTVVEHHPHGTHGWSIDAPIAPAFFPYNRCDVWTCKACARPFLRYTEYGGYYEDDRIRQVNAALIEDAQP
ncbi:MAG: hypothetical protein IV088_05425 [Hydrogenophaga sp.]|uniref:hypothetical protein n=1 Tax=Hydrogenophaga sp. TaxID=1904254 RepID=UPI0025BAD83C|nr:hypothetical protein [Hydrogenophaga sp.]MBT9550269.1 hypothetical protein [Hydrogenophaga sp.]